MKSEDAFFVLGLKPSSSYKEIQQAYDKLTSELNVKRKNADSIQEMSKADKRLFEINEAYQALAKEKYKNVEFSEDEFESHIPSRIVIYNISLLILALLIMVSALLFSKNALIWFSIIFGAVLFIMIIDLIVNYFVNR